MDTIVRITAVAAGLLFLVAASTVAGQTTVSYRVNGPMDDPVLGAVEEIVRVRLGAIGVVVTSIERDAEKRTIRVAMDTGTRTIQVVDDRLARLDRFLCAAVVADRDVRGSLGKGFDPDALRDTVYARLAQRCGTARENGRPFPVYRPVPIYRNPANWLIPASHGDAPRFEFFPHSRAHGLDDDVLDGGAFTSLRKRFTDKSVTRYSVLSAKLLMGASFSLLSDSSRSNSRSGELLFVFNGRPTARLHGEIAPTYASVTCLLFNSDAGRGGAAFQRRVERRALWRTLTPLHRLRDL